ncbi:MAG TPA: diacylglycerol kinase family protein [Lacipirellulaceae bacterium]|nr:diacylglycerol kinase family protein [Lacipirellulaceae bacterium]
MTASSQPETAILPRRRATCPPPDARVLLTSMNPRAGSRARHETADAIHEALANRGYEVHTTTNLDHLKELAIACQKSGELRAIVAMGGDGTAAIVRKHTPLDVPLVPVPMGTENLLGRYVGQITTPQAVCQTIDDGVIISLDLGRAGDKIFLLMMSAGFDAEVVRSLHARRRGNIGRSTYLWHIVRAMRSYVYPPMRLYLQPDGDVRPPPRVCRWIFGFNLPLYAFGLPIAPDAVGTDGLLDVCTLERGRFTSILRYLWYVARKAHLTLPDAAVCRAARFRLEPTSEAIVAYQIDGDYGGTLPVEVEVLGGQLRLLVPRETAHRLGFIINLPPGATDRPPYEQL